MNIVDFPKWTWKWTLLASSLYYKCEKFSRSFSFPFLSFFLHWYVVSLYHYILYISSDISERNKLHFNIIIGNHIFISNWLQNVATVFIFDSVPSQCFLILSHFSSFPFSLFFFILNAIFYVWIHIRSKFVGSFVHSTHPNYGGIRWMCGSFSMKEIKRI